MSSPYVESFIGGASPCTSLSCEPFYIREWETMIVSTLIAVFLLYTMCACGYDRFVAKKNSANPYRSLANSQRLIGGGYDDRVGVHEGFADYDKFDIKKIRAQLPDLTKGMRFQSMGPQVSKFMDFAKVDNIDSLKPAEPKPTHQPQTPDSVLEDLIRV